MANSSLVSQIQESWDLSAVLERSLLRGHQSPFPILRANSRGTLTLSSDPEQRGINY